MAERFKAPVLKTGEGSNLPWVRIPLSPPSNQKAPEIWGFFVRHCFPMSRESALRNPLDWQSIDTTRSFLQRIDFKNSPSQAFGVSGIETHVWQARLGLEGPVLRDFVDCTCRVPL